MRVSAVIASAALVGAALISGYELSGTFCAGGVGAVDRAVQAGGLLIKIGHEPRDGQPGPCSTGSI